ncbi:MAG: hypothetical protein IT385_04520 [Deltaproteobacteria bacterium]|nr:hypothetical protein [Deltaproteobacteria bacterium]
MSRRLVSFSTLVLGAALAGCGAGDPPPGSAGQALEVDDWGGDEAHGEPPYEVWLVDQSDSPGHGYGGRIFIYDGNDLTGRSAPDAPAEVVDLAGQTNDLCWANTGANPRGAHMLLFNSTHSHAIVSFVFTGHVAIIEASSREAVACFRTEAGAGGARQAHAAFPTPDDQYIVVANQNGKKLERIRTDYANGTFTQEPAATINLATCTAPSGAPCETPTVSPRPDNAPICPVPLPNGQVAVTLRGGGLFIVETSTTPMSIVAEYDRATIAPNGCGGTIVQDALFITSGAGTIPANPWSWDIYALPTSFEPTTTPNDPPPVVVNSSNQERRDAHGVVPARVSRGAAEANYLWVADRGLGRIRIYDAVSFAEVSDFPMEEGQDDIVHLTPDLLDTSPMGNRIFASLRGPAPLTGAHASFGTVPGVGVFKVSKNGARGELMSVVPISNIDAQGVERADGHGIAVRRL